MIKNKKIGLGMLVITLTFGIALTSCATISKENIGTFPNISVPAKDFTSLGLVLTENVVENNQGQVFTYNELVKLAKELGADAIVNVTIDTKYEGTKLGPLNLSGKTTWYGAATAIKWVPGVIKNTTTAGTTTKESVIMTSPGTNPAASSLAGLLGK